MNSTHTRHTRLLTRTASAAAVLLLLCAVALAEPPIDQRPLARIAPFAGRYCLECHQGEDAEGALALDRVISSGVDTATTDDWARVLGVLENGRMPPGEADQPSEPQRLAATRAVQQQLTELSCSGEPDAGRETIRRLTRNEYRNTIRDLVGIDFKAAEDFPDEDVGYGFDNIGDVLSLSPMLLEKYLGAAEDILDQAIVTETVIKPRMQYFEPAQLRRAPEMAAEPGWLTHEGELSTDFDVTHDGKYALRVWAWQQAAGDEAARMSIKLGERELGQFDVSTGRGHPRKYEVTAALRRGRYRVAAAFLNDYWNPELEKDRDRNLSIGAIEVAGPFDAAAVELPATHRKIIFVRPSEDQGGRDEEQEGRQANNQTEVSKEAAARQVIQRFAGQAFRRPASDEEVARLLRLFSAASAEGDTFEEAVQVALTAVLVSPHFLFRVERDRVPTEPRGTYRISNYELASRLSYFLWSSMPDEKLLRLAKQGKLTDSDVLDQQVGRMLRSPKARALVDNFAAQWLQLRRLDEVQPDTEQFPFDEELRMAMYEEATALFERVMREDRSVLELLDADYTFVNERLARHYGMEGIRGDKMRQVALLDDRRGGVLTTAAVLTLTSNPTRTSPVKRGKWILEQLLGITNVPPPDVPELDESPPAAKGTVSLRDQLRRHTADANCATCHSRMDPLGFSLENYDAVGRWRQQDRNQPIDASATLPDGTKFSGAAGLKRVLARRKDKYVECLAEALLTFALGRGLEHFDVCAVQGIADRAAANDYRFTTMITGVVRSYPFQFRRQLLQEEVEDDNKRD